MNKILKRIIGILPNVMEERVIEKTNDRICWRTTFACAEEYQLSFSPYLWKTIITPSFISSVSMRVSPALRTKDRLQCRAIRAFYDLLRSRSVPMSEKPNPMARY